MIRRAATAAAVSLTATLGIALAVPAHAATGNNGAAVQHRAMASAKARINAAVVDGVPYYGTCKLVVPTTARVVRDHLAIPVSVTNGCALHPGPLALWYVGSEEDPKDFIFFIDEKGTTWDMYADTPLGKRTWLGDGAIDDDANLYLQNAPQTTVKVGSWAGLQTSRSGNKVTVTPRAVRYATSLDRNIPWAGQKSTIQYRAVGGSSWTNLKSLLNNASGTASYTYTTSATREYRVVYNEATYIWGAVSPTSRR